MPTASHMLMPFLGIGGGGVIDIGGGVIGAGVGTNGDCMGVCSSMKIVIVTL